MSWTFDTFNKKANKFNEGVGPLLPWGKKMEYKFPLQVLFFFDIFSSLVIITFSRSFLLHSVAKQ